MHVFHPSLSFGCQGTLRDLTKGAKNTSLHSLEPVCFFTENKNICFSVKVCDHFCISNLSVHDEQKLQRFLTLSLWLIVNVTGTNDLANSEHRMFRGPQLTSSLHSLKGQIPLATRRILYVFFYRSTKIENYEIYYFWWSFFHRELLPRL